ncbi:MAG: M48 family metalloprotease [Pseudomonadota bacterium]
MKSTASFRTLLFVAGFVTITACAPQPVQRAPQPSQTRPTAALPETSARRSPQQQRVGDENHPKLLQRYGGVYDDPELTAYVNGLGRDLAAVSEQPNEKWTFTVLDNPTVNAFAIPGGYVYVTRGLVSLANSEAELAGVIGHEIGHVTAGHSSLRQERSTIAQGALLGALILGKVLGAGDDALRSGAQIGQAVAGGYLANYSRADELAADNLGIRYLARAGYDPYAQADFLESMGASQALDAKMTGRSYNPNATNFLASHPANGPRTRQAIAVAQNSGETIPAGAPRNRSSFLRVIDGITYGDSPEQGFVRGSNFSHPVLRFSYDSPRGFRILNSSAAVVAQGPNNARFVLDGGKNPQGDLTTYIRREWVPTIGQKYRVGRVRNVVSRPINGLEAASAEVPVQIGNQAFNALLVAIRLDGKLYRLTGLSPQGQNLIPAMRQAANTFRRLSVGEAARLKPQLLEVVTVRAGDTVESLARRMKVPGEFAIDRFRVLNALERGDRLTPGERVKVIR